MLYGFEGVIWQSAYCDAYATAYRSEYIRLHHAQMSEPEISTIARKNADQTARMEADAALSDWRVKQSERLTGWHQ